MDSKSEAHILLKEILAKYDNGELVVDLKDNPTDEYCAITVWKNRIISNEYNCRVLVDHYRDKQGNLVYTVEQHIDKAKGYHAITINGLEMPWPIGTGN